ncbi:GAF domain-containing sensor histidine kinase [Leptothermofonsia sp. ETS-13]|uniref:sensor histidine kinase n=1 Tax=Leptothermofonsia sp. ETS-13 TaxID=3035696 RepID=UPI003B9F6EC5
MQAPPPGNLQVKSESMPVQLIPVAEPSSVDKAQMCELQWQRERAHLISKMTGRIHQSQDLQEILDTAVADVRHFLQTDRVIILRFEPNWSGVIVVESVGEGWLPILGTIIKDPCFEKSYENGGIAKFSRVIEDINTAGLTRCHVDLLTQYQVRANLVLPIIQAGDRLWGVLIAHHCREPRKWQPLEVELLQELVTQVAIAIQQSELYQQVQRLNTNLEQQIRERTRQLEQSLDFAAVLKRITDRIRDSLDEHQILQTAVRELVSVLKVDYCCAALYNSDRTDATIQCEFTHAELGSAIGQTLAVADTPRVHYRLLSGQHFEAYENGRIAYLQTAETGDMACPPLFDRFAAKLLCPIFLDPASCKPMKDSNPNSCGIEPGAIGYLAVIDQTYHIFSDTEVELVKQVANQCAIAIRQARLYEASQSQVEALEKLNQLKDDFLSTISHELRTPLAGMKMAIQMLEVSLKKHSILSKKTFDYLKILHDLCEREIELINDLLSLQQLESGDQPLNPAEVQLQPWLTQWLQSLQKQTQFQQRILQIEYASQLPLLICDIPSLERILLELLNNACKHSDSGSPIQLKVWAEGEAFFLSVCNSGSDIPTNELSRIFDKFYRIPRNDPWKQGGTGLGLALVQQLVNRLKGSIQATSASGQTCFTVKLPLQPR